MAGPLRTPPSGEQHELRRGEQRAVVTEVGATLREYAIGGRELIDGFALDERAEGARGMALIPWPNRIRDGRYTWEGEEQQLDLTEVPRANAIHGLVRWRGWQPLERDDDRLVMGLQLLPMPGYPFALALLIEYRLTDAGLVVSTRAENIGARACPYGVGFHPYLATAGETIDAAHLRLPAARRMLIDDRGIPTGAETVAGGRFDFRSARPIGELELDDCFFELERDSDGRARVTLAAEGTTVALWLGDGYEYVMVYTGEGLAPPRRRRSLGVEPMSCAP